MAVILGTELDDTLTGGEESDSILVGLVMIIYLVLQVMTRYLAKRVTTV